MIRPLSLVEGADLAGRYRYVELALFETLGARAAESERAEVALYLSGASLAHAYRAQIAETILPISPGLVERGWTRSPGPVFDEVLDELASPGDDLIDAVVGVVYPAMVAAYGSHLDGATGISDGPMRRALRRMIADLAGVIAEAASLGSFGGGTRRARRVGELLARVPGPFGKFVAGS